MLSVSDNFKRRQFDNSGKFEFRNKTLILFKDNISIFPPVSFSQDKVELWKESFLILSRAESNPRISSHFQKILRG